MAPRPAPLLVLLALLCAASAAHLADYAYMSNLRGPQFGDWCDETDDCADEDSKLECRDQKCACRNGFEYSDGFCKRRAGAAPPEPPTLGNWCEESVDCEAVSSHMECRDALCECSEGYVALNGTCTLPSHGRSLPGLPSPRPGDPCEESEDCALVEPNMECRVGSCACKEGYNTINGTCQTILTVTSTAATASSFGDPCDETINCTENKNLECRNSRCECKEGFDIDGELCKPQPKTDPPPTRRPSVLGDWCFQDEDCGDAGANTECFGGVCLCKQGFVPEDGRCVVDKPPEVTSTTTTTTSRPRPQKPPRLGDWCLDNLDCALTDDNMECFSEVCLCKQGYVQREGLCKKEINTPMLWSGEKDVMSKVGGLCEERSDCPPEENVECRRGYCECVHGYFEHEGKCRRKIDKIGAACNEITDVCYLEDDDGDVKTACVQGKCQCKQGLFLANGRCKKRINGLGTRCHPDRHICFLDVDGNDTKTECREETCRCKEGFEESSGICVITNLNKELGASCQNDRGCSSISHAKCNDGKCVCKEGYGPMTSHNCGKRVGDRCDDGVCDAVNTQCTKRSSDRNEVSVCVCKRLHLSSSNRTYCYTWPTSIGDLCDQSPYCKFLGENVECVEGRCLCREDFAFQDGICVKKVHL